MAAFAVNAERRNKMKISEVKVVTVEMAVKELEPHLRAAAGECQKLNSNNDGGIQMDFLEKMKKNSMAHRLLSLTLVVAIVAALAPPKIASANQVTATCTNSSSDAETINNAISSSSIGDEIVIGGTCSINQIIKLLPKRTYRGENRMGTVLKQADGANLKAIMASDTYVDNVTHTGSGVTIRSLTVHGNKENNTSVATSGIVLRSWLSTVSDVYVTNMKGSGIVVTNLSENGTALSGTTQVNGSITGNFIEKNDQYGVYVQDTGNACTDWTLADNWIASSGIDGIHMDNAAGWMVERNHIYNVPQHAIYAHRMFGTAISDNYIEGFGESATGGTYYGIYGTVQGGFTSLITGNRVQNIKKEANTGSTYRYIGINNVNYGTGVLNVANNVIRGASTPRGTGLYYNAGSNSLQVMSTGNHVYGVNTARTIGSGVTLTTAETEHIPNSAPVLAPIGHQTVNEGKTLEFVINATDSDGDTVTYSVYNAPAGAVLDPAAAKFTWTPDYTQSGTYAVVFIASDGELEDREDVTITVQNVTATDLIQENLDYINRHVDTTIKHELVSKLDNVLDSIHKGNETAAFNQLNAYVNSVKAQQGMNLTVEQANTLLDSAGNIKLVITLD
ncbi:MAG: hypothetical protein K0S39_424 [Paenibacillus sp.]|jgi:hypothetical protein|nr:hypothetical protein [Paenibacillus sp.]